MLILLLSLRIPSSPSIPLLQRVFHFCRRTADIFSSVSSLNAFRWRSLLYYLYNTIFPLLSLSTRVAREHFSNADSYSLRRFFRLAVRFFEDGTGEERRRARSSIIECHIRWSIGRWMNVAVEESRGRNGTRKGDKSSRPVSPVNSRDASPRETWIYSH